MSDLNRFRWLNTAVVMIIIANLICGVISICTSQNLFFSALSLWVVGGMLLAFLHGTAMLGFKNIIMFFIVGMAVSLFFESMGANFGLFFSKYHYTDYIPGPKLFGFDVYSMVAYGLGCYMIWVLAQAVVGQFDNKFRRGDVVLIPIVSALLLVSIDFATDPLLSTIHNVHIWEKPGVFYGIPYQNYLGWYLMAYVLYQIPAIILYWQDRNNRLTEPPPIARKKKFWIYAPILFASVFIQLPFYTFIESKQLVVASGQVFWTHEIYWGVMLVNIGAVLTPSLIILLRVIREETLE